VYFPLILFHSNCKCIWAVYAIQIFPHLGCNPTINVGLFFFATEKAINNFFLKFSSFVMSY
jgi:hypothetical protein